MVVDGNGDSFSNNEFDEWLLVVGIAFGACLVAAVALVSRPVGRGMLLATLSAALVVGAARMVEVLVNSSSSRVDL